jgi:peptidoglycan/xylan/chitin deacetylase (PgdA/CDA1 family)
VQRVALTFDDGPGDWTEPILDVLAANDAKATFFVIGSNVEGRIDTLSRVVGEGHEIGNHTWSHPWLARDCDDERVRDELERTSTMLAGLLGTMPRRFRAPRYDVDDRVVAVAARLGLSHTRSDVAPPDWDARCTAGFIATFVLNQAREDAVIGLHDGLPPARTRSSDSRAETVRAVETFVPRLRERGFVIVSAGELLDGSARG